MLRKPDPGTAAATGARREVVYQPEQRPGFVAWTTAFDYGDGSVGLVFKETVQQHNPAHTPARLEFSEAAAYCFSYSSVFCGSPHQASYRVYLRSHDNGKTFTETGRAPEGVGSYCNIGFADGRIIGYHVPTRNEDGTAWGHCIEVHESRDGGSTWTLLDSLLPGNGIYLWRVRRLRDGTVILMASFYGSPWGPGFERVTRNTMLPGETPVSKIVPFFMASQDGVNFTGPHYILPGTGAHEYDVVETDEGHLLFITGDVQGTPVGRQLVLRQGGRFINRPLLPIRRGAPGPGGDSQSGSVPETIVALPGGVLVGARRHKPYTCSVDMGENWYEVDGLPPSLYQPFMQLMPDGTVANFGHLGGDVSFGQVDMYIGADFFRVEEALPRPTRLRLERCLAPDGGHYQNRYRALLTQGEKPLAGRAVRFRFDPFWRQPQRQTAGNPVSQEITAKTGPDGWAETDIPAYDEVADIHFSYTAQAFFDGSTQDMLDAAESPYMTVYALRPHRSAPHPYDAYLANGVLYLSPAVLQQWPNAIELLQARAGGPSSLLDERALPPGLVDTLARAHVLKPGPGGLHWAESVHAPAPLADVKAVPEEGEVYV